MAIPETRYAKSGNVNIAYSTLGDGPIDIVFAQGFVSHLEYMWEEPLIARFLGRLASFSRLIMFDKRGTGMSDRVAPSDLPTLEERMDDMRAVMDAAGSRAASLLGWSEGGSMCMLFAATYPERTNALVLYSTYASFRKKPDYQFALLGDQDLRPYFDQVEANWGKSAERAAWAPVIPEEEEFGRFWSRYFRLSASPGAGRTIVEMAVESDVRHVLSAIRVPTLVIHRRGDPTAPVEGARYIAAHVEGSHYVELPGSQHVPFVGDTSTMLDEIEEFLTGERPHHEPDRVLATVLYTDIVSSTEQLASLGDRKWHDLLEAHHAAVRKELARFRGREVSTAGDGFLATFDGPARAIRCARAIQEAVRPLGVEVRAGLHTGECEIMGDDIAGIAVHTGARVAALAGGGEVLVSSTVKDLVAGSGIEFADRGAYALKGVPGEWRIFAVTRA
jgi:pimeloyl-ACP methyl ester carboxylesterase